MIKRARIPSPLLALMATGSAVAETSSTFDMSFSAESPARQALQEHYSIEIEEFHLGPMANLVYDHGRVELHPKAYVLGGYDSNFRASPSHPEGSAYGAAAVGADVRYAIDQNQTLTFSGEASAHAYEADHTRDLIGALTRLRYDVLQSENTKHRIDIFYDRLDDPLLETGGHFKRELIGGSIDTDYERRLLHLGFGLAYVNQTFLETSIGAAQPRDSDAVNALMTAGYRSGAVTEWQLKLSGGFRDYHGDGLAQDERRFAVIGGWRAAPTARIAITIDAGVQEVLFADDYAHDPAYGDRRVVAPIGHFTAVYTFEESSSVAITLAQDVYPSVIANAMVVRSADLRGRYRLLQNAAFIADVEAVHLDVSGAAAGQPRESRDRYTARAGGGYFLREGVGTKLQVSDEVSDSKTLNDYHRWTIQLSLGIVY